MTGRNDSNEDDKWMRRALELAKNGLKTTSPNPMVGCVIVLDSEVIAEGWHEKCGEAHAEVNALAEIPNYTRDLLKNATAYVTLEPCSHQGKTPPCTDLLIERGLGRVVSAMVDPNGLVSGKGHEKLQQAGIKTTTGVLESDARKLNKQFIHLHNSELPYITLKWVQSKDGFIDPEIDAPTGRGSYPITSDAARVCVHTLRALHTGILVGRKTIEVDDPSLNVRLIEGVSPIRIVIDPDLSLDMSSYKIANLKGETWLLHNRAIGVESATDYAKYIKAPLHNLESTLKLIRDQGIHSVLIEGGAYTLMKFIDKGLWNDAYVFSSNSNLTNGLSAPKIDGLITEERDLDIDSLKIYTNKN